MSRDSRFCAVFLRFYFLNMDPVLKAIACPNESVKMFCASENFALKLPFRRHDQSVVNSGAKCEFGKQPLDLVLI